MSGLRRLTRIALFFEQMVEAGMEDEKVTTAARANSPDDFITFFERLFNDMVISRMEGNEEITSMAFTNEQARALMVKDLAGAIWGRVNAPPSA